MQGYRAKRMGLRVPVSLPVRCQQEDGAELGGKATNLSTGGIGFSTSSPIKKKELLSIEFRVLDTLNPVNVTGEVVWSQFHYDAPERAESLFVAGIKFLKAQSPFRDPISDHLLKLFWKQYLFGIEDIEGLLADIDDYPVQERRIVFHNYFFCLLFAEERCPHQRMIERAYIVPQVLSTKDLVQCQNTCWNCSVYRVRPVKRGNQDASNGNNMTG